MNNLIKNEIVEEKNNVQRDFLREVNGDLKEYSKIVHKEFLELQKKYPGKFKTCRKELTNIEYTP
jgi:hypothetical protein